MLYWSAGIYLIRTEVIKELTSKVCEYVKLLKSEPGSPITVIFQWVNSHAGCKGNEYADKLAKKGMQKIDKRCKCPVWKFYSFKAAKNKSNQPWMVKMERTCEPWRKNARNEALYQEH